MLMHKASRLVSSQDWTYEPKRDGFRVIAMVRDGSVRLLSRNGCAHAAIHWSTAPRLIARRFSKAANLGREQVDCVGVPLGPFRIVVVLREDWLSVRQCGNEASVPVPALRPIPAEERPDRLASKIPLPPGRHVQDGILLEESNQTVEVRSLPART